MPVRKKKKKKKKKNTSERMKEMRVQKGVQKVTTQNREFLEKKLEVLEKTYCRSQLVL